MTAAPWLPAALELWTGQRESNYFVQFTLSKQQQKGQKVGCKLAGWCRQLSFARVASYNQQMCQSHSLLPMIPTSSHTAPFMPAHLYTRYRAQFIHAKSKLLPFVNFYSFCHLMRHQQAASPWNCPTPPHVLVSLPNLNPTPPDCTWVI